MKDPYEGIEAEPILVERFRATSSGELSTEGIGNGLCIEVQGIPGTAEDNTYQFDLTTDAARHIIVVVPTRNLPPFAEMLREILAKIGA